MKFSSSKMAHVGFYYVIYQMQIVEQPPPGSLRLIIHVPCPELGFSFHSFTHLCSVVDVGAKNNNQNDLFDLLLPFLLRNNFEKSRVVISISLFSRSLLQQLCFVSPRKQASLSCDCLPRRADQGSFAESTPRRV